MLAPRQPLHHSYVRNRTLSGRVVRIYSVLVLKIDATRISINRVKDFATRTERAGEPRSSRSFSHHSERRKFSWSFSRQYKIFNGRASSHFFFSLSLTAPLFSWNNCQWYNSCVRAFTCSVRASYVEILSVHVRDQRRFYAPWRSCEFTARVPLCPVRTRGRALLHSCAREFTSCVLLARKRSIRILVRFTADRRWCIVSYVSIGIFSLPRATVPSSDRPSFPPAPPFPPPPPPRRALSLFLSLLRSFTPAALTNAGYNSIVGHDPQGALTPRTYLASSMTNWIKPDYLHHNFIGKVYFDYSSLIINLLKKI